MRTVKSTAITLLTLLLPVQGKVQAQVKYVDAELEDFNQAIKRMSINDRTWVTASVKHEKALEVENQTKDVTEQFRRQLGRQELHLMDPLIS